MRTVFKSCQTEVLFYPFAIAFVPKGNALMRTVVLVFFGERLCCSKMYGVTCKYICYFKVASDRIARMSNPQEMENSLNCFVKLPFVNEHEQK